MDLAKYIDHTLLRPDATRDGIEKVCQESLTYQFASTCIHPTWVSLAKDLLEGSSVKLCTVVGFPLGANTIESKAREAEELVGLGVEEIDMVINIGALKSKMDDTVRKEIAAVVHAASPALVKVIIETSLLTDEEKQQAARLVVEAGAHFVKTSTGFAKSGATVHDVALLRKTVGPHIGVKASGGIRDLPTALAMIEAGATRLGTSGSVALMHAFKPTVEDR